VKDEFGRGVRGGEKRQLEGGRWHVGRLGSWGRGVRAGPWEQQTPGRVCWGTGPELGGWRGLDRVGDGVRVLLLGRVFL